jgi:tol-pal system protein YbgF
MDLMEDYMLKRISLLLVLLSTIGLIGCFTSGQVSRIESDLNKLELQNSAISDDLRDMKRSSMATDKSSSQTIDQLNKTNAELLAQMQNIQNKLDDIQGKIEELNYKLAKSGSNTNAQPDVNAGMDQPVKDEAKGKEDQASQVFNSAQNDYLKGHFDLAVLGFKQFLSLSTDKTKLADAQYWIGECYFSANEMESAIEEFDKFITTYSTDTRIPGVMLKKAIAYFRLKKTSVTQNTLKEIIKKFPNTPEAKLAEERLKAIEEQ